jgi:hypothetical protein
MKIRFIACALLISLGLGIFIYALIQGSPKKEWKSVSVGMNHQEVLKILGPPTNSLKKVKSIEIWKRDGGLKQSFVSVLYYDQNHPDTATHVYLSERWVWQ